MRISDFLLSLIATFGSLFVVSAIFPVRWPDRAKTVFRVIVGVGFFFLVGGYWLTTGEKFDETLYRVVLCRLHLFDRCISNPQPASAAGEADLEAERRRQREREQLAEDAHRLEMEAERRRQQDQRQRQRLAEEERSRELDAERRRQELREIEKRSLRFGATAVGRVAVNRSLRATTAADQSSASEAESKALAQCNEVASDCKVIARFSGRGKCVFVAGGTTETREFGGVRRRSGATSALDETEVLQKCRSVYQTCSIFHSKCNSS